MRSMPRRACYASCGFGKRIDELLADVPPFVSTPELRIDTDETAKFAIVERAAAHFKATHDVIDVDGVRVLFGDGWGLLRASNTQPVIVARFEARSAERLADIARTWKPGCTHKV
jgi:phosphomannomutase/phosphoglucomutase